MSRQLQPLITPPFQLPPFEPLSATPFQATTAFHLEISHFQLSLSHYV
jgi:hypothetical protein